MEAESSVVADEKHSCAKIIDLYNKLGEFVNTSNQTRVEEKTKILQDAIQRYNQASQEGSGRKYVATAKRVTLKGESRKRVVYKYGKKEFIKVNGSYKSFTKRDLC